jgi:EAL domain-containing protein (putative c-di-GMP-specific phosphodiesterase class I)
MLRARRDEHRPVRLFVSQSPRTLARDGYAAWVAEAMAAYELDGPTLVIDVPLADALIHAVTLRQFCEQLVPAGVQFCLSRFQPGEEADALMAQLPLGFVRLSARYADGNSDGALRDEMRLAIERAHRRGLQVIGQQVEDPQAAATLWMSGIDFIQGNLVQQAAGDLDFDFQHAVL